MKAAGCASTLVEAVMYGYASHRQRFATFRAAPDPAPADDVDRVFVEDLEEVEAASDVDVDVDEADARPELASSSSLVFAFSTASRSFSFSRMESLKSCKPTRWSLSLSIACTRICYGSKGKARAKAAVMSYAPKSYPVASSIHTLLQRR